MRDLLLCLLLLTSCFVNAQEEKTLTTNDGKFYIFWGWNTANYTKSDIQFKGADYDFTIENVVAKDRPSKFNADTYFNPANLTIPQTNFRLGYFLTEKTSINFGFDHMKYVLQNGQTAYVHGEISRGSSFDGSYAQYMEITNDFVEFEHTDGLNYIHLGLRHHHNLYNKRHIKIDLIGGGDIGTLMPRTDAKVIEKDRSDHFHFSGFGFGGISGLNIRLFNNFDLQTELKGGYIRMYDIRTTNDNKDRALQSFFFLQHNFMLGTTVKI